MGAYSFLWRNVDDGTDLTSSGYINLSTQRTSSRFDGNLTVTYEGGDNSTDYIAIGDVRIGNLTNASSPAVFTVPGGVIDVPCPIHYVFNSSATNITNTELDYYSYSGCEYDESTCDALTASLNMTGAVMKIPGFLLFMLMILIVLTALRMLVFR